MYFSVHFACLFEQFGNLVTGYFGHTARSFLSVTARIPQSFLLTQSGVRDLLSVL